MDSPNRSFDLGKTGEIGRDLLKHALYAGGFFSFCGWAFYQVVEHNPDRSFGLLEKFGPAFVLGGMGLLGAYKLIDKLGGGMTQQMGRMADGVAKLAERDDRQQEEMQLIAMFNAQASEKIFALLERDRAASSEQREKILEVLEEYGAQMNRLSAKVDSLVQGGEGGRLRTA